MHRAQIGSEIVKSSFRPLVHRWDPLKFAGPCAQGVSEC